MQNIQTETPPAEVATKVKKPLCVWSVIAFLIEAFDNINNYKDVEEETKRAYYLWGKDCKEKGDYDNAINCFLKVQDYSDALDQAFDSGYLKAVNDYNSGNYEDAYEMFCTIQTVVDVKDYLSDEKIKSAAVTFKTKKFEEARALCAEGKYEEAAEVYCKIPEYNEHQKRVIRYFADVLDAVMYDGEVFFKGINSSSYAKDNAIYIEKNFKTASKKEIRQMYLASEVVLYMSIEIYSSSDYDLLAQGRGFARQIDKSYSGPFDKEIITIANYALSN